MRKFSFQILFVSIWMLPAWANAQHPTEVQFISQYDNFTVQFSNAQWQIQKTPIDFQNFEQFFAFFTTDLSGPCNVEGKPELTAKALMGKQSKQIKFYIAKQVVSDGKNCVAVNNEAIYFLPLHRSWYLGPNKGNLNIGQEFTLTIEKEPIGTFTKSRNEWSATNSPFFINWDFALPFIDSLGQYKISQRAHLDAAKNKRAVNIKVGNQTHEFYLVQKALWMTKSPDGKWLIGSPNWSIWREMEIALWTDRLMPQLTALTDAKKDVKSRLGIISTLESQWSFSIRDAYYKILLNEREPVQLRMEVVRVMKQKPTLNNMGIFVQALEKNHDPELLAQITQALRIRNPKGTLLGADSDEDEIAKARADWQKWWKSAQSKPD